jgi:hypothetical protein
MQFRELYTGNKGHPYDRIAPSCVGMARKRGVCRYGAANYFHGVNILRPETG